MSLTVHAARRLLEGAAGLAFAIALYAERAPKGRYGPKGEVTGRGYTPGGLPLADARVTTSALGAALAFGNPAWPEDSRFGARQAVIYERGSGEVWAVLDFGELVEARNAPFVVTLIDPIRLDV